MNLVLYLFAGALGLAATLASIAIWAPRALRVKVAALALAALFVPLAYASVVELLSRPKPLDLEWIRTAGADTKVLGADLREGERIYLWLRVPGVDEPRAYALPWDQKLAEQLHRAQHEASEQGTEVRARNLFRKAPKGEEKPVFYARPQEALPPKQAPALQPFVFESGVQSGRPGGG